MHDMNCGRSLFPFIYEILKITVPSSETNGICERVHQTILNEFYRVAFPGGKKLFMEKNLDEKLAA